MDTVRIDSAPPAAARPALPSPDQRHRYDSDPDAGWIIVAHLLAPMFGAFAGWLALTIAGRRSTFVRQHARQSINFQINAFLAGLVCLFLQVSVSAVFALPLMGLGVGSIIACFVAAARAKNGAWRPYPQLLPILRSLPEPMPY